MIDDAKFQTMEKVAEKLFRGGVFSAEVKSADTAFAIILAGDEMGYEPMAAARAIALVKGKVSLSADAMIGLVKRSAQCESWRVVETTAAECTITTKRVGDDGPTTLTYTIAMAQRAGLTGSQTWRSHPEAMLRARCGAALARAVYPDVCGGLYDPDEADEIRSHDRGASRDPKPSAKKPEPTADESDREPEPSCPPALAAFYAGLPGLADPTAGALLWHEHRAALNAAEGTDRPAAWDALVKRLVRFGGGVASITAAKNFLKGKLAELGPKPAPAVVAAPVEPQPVEAPVEAPAPEAAPVEASPEPAAAPFVEQLARCATLDAVATLWLAAREDIAQGTKADQAAAWGAAVERLAVIQHCAPSKALGVLLSKRIKILAGEEPDPNGPKGAPSGDMARLSDAHGTGEHSANDATAVQALHRVLDTDLSHITIAGTWRETEAGWREHLGEMTARKRVEASVGCNGAALGPRFLTLAAERIVALDDAKRPPGSLRLTVIGVVQTLERIALDGSRARSAHAAQQAA